MRIIGPFSQIVTMQNLALKGALADDQLHIIENGGVCINDTTIKEVGKYADLVEKFRGAEREEIEEHSVLLPGFVDCHTHICFAGNRNADYASRIAGKSYLDIAKAGGGIWNSVDQTRQATEQDLTNSLLQRVERHLHHGVTTIEIKSGYGLNVEDELKMLRAIQQAASQTHASLVPTCLAAHTLPKDFPGNHQAYLHSIIQDLLPLIRMQGLAKRVDIFIEESAFQPAAAFQYLNVCRDMGFQVTVHADQFTTGGSKVAVEANALSADHLEASTEKELQMIANSNTVAVVLPGASMGLGMPFAKARKLLDLGACVAISTDWNPGSAPMGDLLMQAAVMGASEKLTTAETFAGITCRAAHALGLHERGVIVPGFKAHLQAYPTHDYRDILYYQGTMKPCRVWA